jgi:hypothetical protein
MFKKWKEYVICVMLKLEPGSKQDLGGQVAQVLVENSCFSYLSLRPSLQFPHRHYRIFILVSVADILSGAKNFCAKMPRKYRAWGLTPMILGDARFFFGCLCKFGFFLYYSRWTKYSNPATRTMLNPRAPKSQCFSAHVTKNDVRGLISFVHWG